MPYKASSGLCAWVQWYSGSILIVDGLHVIVAVQYWSQVCISLHLQLTNRCTVAAATAFVIIVSRSDVMHLPSARPQPQPHAAALFATAADPLR